MTQDALDLLVDQWREQRPELDAETMAMFGRLARLHNHLANRIWEHHKLLGFSRFDFDVLATLRRSGPPYRLTPTELYRASMLTSGAMTNRLDKLEQAGLIERRHSATDRRSIEVQLTEQGLRMIDDALPQHVAHEQQLASPLSPAQQQQLNQLLKLWLAAFE